MLLFHRVPSLVVSRKNASLVPSERSMTQASPATSNSWPLRRRRSIQYRALVGLVVWFPQLDTKRQVRGTSSCRAAMGRCRKPSASLDHGLQRGCHGLGEERDGIREVALAGSVPPNEEGRILKGHLGEREAAEAVQPHSTQDAIDLLSPSRGQHAVPAGEYSEQRPRMRDRATARAGGEIV